MRCVAKLSRASTLENCAQSTSAKFHFIPNQPTNKSANQTVWGDDCGPGRMLGPVFVRVRDSLDSTPSGKSPSSHHAAAKKTHASTQATINGSRSARHALPLGLPCHYFLTLEGQEAANHVLPQPCRRRRALRFLGQCLHVSFWDTASTDAIYLCARVWREQVG